MDAIHAAHPDQAPAIAAALLAFNREFGSAAPPLGEVTASLRQLLATGEIVVLVCGEEPLGLALLSFRRTVWADGPVALLEELYVVPEQRGRGIGRALMETMLDRARAAGCAWVEVTTGETDSTARALYESLGFTNLEDSRESPRMLYYELEL